MTAEPTSIRSVCPASQASTVGLSEPYASAAQTDVEAQRLRVAGEPQLTPRVLRADEVAEVQTETHAATVVASGPRVAAVAG